jgi:hypothetical protein
MIENLVDFVLNVGLGAVALLCLFEGARRLGAHGVHRKAVLMILVAGGVCALYGGFAYVKYGNLKATVSAAQTKRPAAQVAANWSRAASPEKKEALSQASARQAFTTSGTLGPYIDRNGQTKTFVPTQQDLTARERIVAYYSRTEYTARSSLAEAVLWLIAGITAVVLGLLLSLDKPPVRTVPDDALGGEPLAR